MNFVKVSLHLFIGRASSKNFSTAQLIFAALIQDSRDTGSAWCKQQL